MPLIETVVAVELDPEYVITAVIDSGGRLTGRAKTPIGTTDFDEIIAIAVGAIQETALSCEAVDVIALATHGSYSAATGTVTWGGSEFPLLDALRSHMSLPVSITSRRLAAIAGESAAGAAFGARSAVFVSAGNSVEAGILSDGRLVHGAHDAAGAHFPQGQPLPAIIAGLIAAIDPEIVVLGGVAFNEGLIDSLKSAHPTIQIEWTALGDDAALHGAARLAIDAE